MRPAHLALALAVAAVWGVNFVFIALGLRELPVVLFCALRYAAAAVPLVFLVPRPRVPLRLLAAYAAVQFVGQFVLLFAAISIGLPAGLASLVVQVQAFFTMLRAVPIHGERPHRLQWIGAAVGFSGVAAVGAHLPGSAPAAGLALALAAAVSWAAGNLITKRMGSADPKALVAWGSALAAPVLLAASLAIDGPQEVARALGSLSATGVAAVAVNAYAATLFGYGAWSFLLRRYPAATVTPFALLVPLTGMGSTALALGERLTAWAAVAAALVIAGLARNLAGARRAAQKRGLSAALR